MGKKETLGWRLSVLHPLGWAGFNAPDPGGSPSFASQL